MSSKVIYCDETPTLMNDEFTITKSILWVFYLLPYESCSNLISNISHIILLFLVSVMIFSFSFHILRHLNVFCDIMLTTQNLLFFREQSTIKYFRGRIRTQQVKIHQFKVTSSFIGIGVSMWYIIVTCSIWYITSSNCFSISFILSTGHAWTNVGF